LQHYPDASAVVRALAPDEPVILNRPAAAARAARFFTEKFPGKSLYAVKANPSPDLLKVLWEAGVTHYDVASIAEVRLVRATLPDAVLCFMHPVKTASAIAEAYKIHGVRVFSLDTQEELDKIVAATANEAGDGAEDLSLGIFGTQPCRQVRHRPCRCRAAAAGDPPGGGQPWHLLPRRQPGDDAVRLCSGARARARGDCRCLGHG
jgi:hypothetical protein